MRYLFAIIFALACRGCELCPAAEVDFERLADAIKLEENSVKYPYGISFVQNGRRIGFAEKEARKRCLSICRRNYALWLSGGFKTGFIAFLSTRYDHANAKSWQKNVEWLYCHRITYSF